MRPFLKSHPSSEEKKAASAPNGAKSRGPVTAKQSPLLLNNTATASSAATPSSPDQRILSKDMMLATESAEAFDALNFNLAACINPQNEWSSFWPAARHGRPSPQPHLGTSSTPPCTNK